MRADWVSTDDMAHVLAALTPPNRLAIQISMATGMRIGDVLAITRDQVDSGRWSYREAKTGKTRRVRLPVLLQERALRQAGRIYVFEGRCSAKRHRTRQAVYKDIIRAAKAFRLSEHISPHSARKMYAVDKMHRTGDIKAVQRDLNHDREATTMIYALADALSARRNRASNA